MPFSDWSTSASSNTSVGGISIAEGAARANMNDAMRAMMAETKAKIDSIETAYSVLESIPANLHAAIRARTVTDDLEAYFDAAAAIAVAANKPLYVPPGTYTMQEWEPPTGLTVLTAGIETAFKQLNTGGTPKRFIRVLADNISLWPGGAATVQGGLTASVNNTAFNGAVYVYAGSGITINKFVMGDLYAQDMGGDGLETGAHSSGTLIHCQVGTVFVSNVLRNGVSVTAGKSGHIAGLIQLGGVGYLAVDFEPDPTSGSPPEHWHIGTIRGHRANFVGDPAVVMGRVRIDHLHLDYDNFTASTPAFDFGGISAATQPTTFQVGVRYRNLASLEVGQAYIAGHAYGAIVDIGSGGSDSYTRMVKFDYLKLYQTGDNAAATAEIALNKTYDFKVGFLEDQNKVSNDDPTFVATTAADSRITIDAGKINGRLINAASGHVTLGAVTIAGSTDNVLRNITGEVNLYGSTITGAAVMFDTCTKVPVCWNCTLGATTMASGGAANARYYRSTVNSVFYEDGWESGINAQAGTSYTLALVDDGRLVTCTNAGAITLTVPANATVAFPLGAVVRVMQGGAGAVTATAAGGVTLRSRGGLVATNGQYAGFTLTKIATNEWLVEGDRA